MSVSWLWGVKCSANYIVLRFLQRNWMKVIKIWRTRTEQERKRFNFQEQELHKNYTEWFSDERELSKNKNDCLRHEYELFPNWNNTGCWFTSLDHLLWGSLRPSAGQAHHRMSEWRRLLAFCCRSKRVDGVWTFWQRDVWASVVRVSQCCCPSWKLCCPVCVFVVDQTPTPTKFLKSCEEVGLFQEINPFDKDFKKAVEQQQNEVCLNCNAVQVYPSFCSLRITYICLQSFCLLMKLVHCCTVMRFKSFSHFLKT